MDEIRKYLEIAVKEIQVAELLLEMRNPNEKKIDSAHAHLTKARMNITFALAQGSD